MESGTETGSIEIGNSQEIEPLITVRDLKVIVHPSHLIGDSDHPLEKSGQYQETTKSLQKTALERFLPSTTAAVLLVMPHETPSLQSWRDSIEAKKKDPELGNWTDLYKSAKTGSPFKDNIIIVDDLTSIVDENSEQERTQALEDAQKSIIEVLQEKGFAIDSNTEITVGGEFRDLCVYETAKKLLLLPQVNKLRIDKMTSFNSPYAYAQTEASLKTLDATKQQMLIDSLDSKYTVNEDEEFITAEKVIDSENVTPDTQSLLSKVRTQIKGLL